MGSLLLALSQADTGMVTVMDFSYFLSLYLSLPPRNLRSGILTQQPYKFG